MWETQPHCEQHLLTVTQIKGAGRRKAFLSAPLALTLPGEFICPVAVVADSFTDIRTRPLGFPVWTDDEQLSRILSDHHVRCLLQKFAAHRLSKYLVLSLSVVKQALSDHDPTL